MRFGERLKEARTKIGKTQEMVASELHVSRQTISSWENERSYPDISSLIELSNYYNLSLDTLLKEDAGMVEEMQRKEQKEKINKMWRLSYALNLLFLATIILGVLFRVSLFKIGLGTELLIVLAIILNVGLLSIITKEKAIMEQKNNPFTIQTKYILFAIYGEVLALVIITILYWTGIFSNMTLLGFIVGMLLVTILAWIILKVLQPK